MIESIILGILGILAMASSLWGHFHDKRERKITEGEINAVAEKAKAETESHDLDELIALTNKQFPGDGSDH